MTVGVTPPFMSHVSPDWAAATAFQWEAAERMLVPVRRFTPLPLDLLLGLDQQRERLLANTQRFALGLPANDALAWGARGMGKSALIKAVFADRAAAHPGRLALIEIARGELASLPRLLGLLDGAPRRVVLYCDDLSFTTQDGDYRALKAVLDGGLEARPSNVIFYATSNRRHLVPRDAVENERDAGLHRDEAVDEHISLSDRFGIWLGFHPCSQEDYLAIVRRYASHFGMAQPHTDLLHAASLWAAERGARSGRVAWQFIQSLRTH